MMIRERLAYLLKLKSIVTLLITGTVCYLALDGRLAPAAFSSIGSSVITYYFVRKDDTTKE